MKTFDSKSEAKRWADEVEGSFKCGKTYRPKNFGEVLHNYLKTVTPKKPSAANETIIINKLLQAD